MMSYSVITGYIIDKDNKQQRFAQLIWDYQKAYRLYKLLNKFIDKNFPSQSIIRTEFYKTEEMSEIKKLFGDTIPDRVKDVRIIKVSDKDIESNRHARQNSN